LCAELYQKHHEFAKAKAEYEQYQRSYPADPMVAGMLEQCAKEESAYAKKVKQVQADTEAVAPTVEKKPEAAVAAPKAEVETAPAPARKGDKRKSPKQMARPDSVTFF
jgi:hypothetical protein